MRQLLLDIVTAGAPPVAERPNAWTVTSPSMPHTGRRNAVDLRDGLDHRVGSECRRRQLRIGARTSPPWIAVRLGSRQPKLDHRAARGETAGLVVIVPGTNAHPPGWVPEAHSAPTDPLTNQQRTTSSLSTYPVKRARKVTKRR